MNTWYCKHHLFARKESVINGNEVRNSNPSWKIILMLLLVALANVRQLTSATVTITTNTNWSAITTGTGGGMPTNADLVIVQGAVTLTVDVSNAVCSTLTIGPSANANNTTSILKFNSGSQLAVVGTTTIGNSTSNNKRGSIDMSLGGLLQFGGTVTVTAFGTFTPGLGTIEFNSTAAQTIPSTSTMTANYNNVVVTGNSVKTLNNNVTLNGSLTINPTATLDAGSSNRDITIAGNWINNGTFNQRSAEVIFNTTSALQTITGAATTTFYDLTITKTAVANTVEVLSTIGSTHDFTINSGTLKFSVGGTMTIGVSDATIAGPGMFWNNAGAVLSMCAGGDLALSGTLRNSSGTITIGTGGGDEIRYSNNSFLIIEGGIVNLSGGYSQNSSPNNTTLNISGGTFNVGTVGATSTSRADFDLSSISTFIMTGGTICIVRPNVSSFTGADYINLATTSTVTGGTLQIGNTTTNSGQTIDINSTVPVFNLVVDATTQFKIARLLTNSLTVKNDVTINAGSTLNCNSLGLTVGGNFSNPGIFTAGPTTTFNSTTSGKTISGNLIGTNKFNSIVFDGVGGAWSFSNDADASNAFTITNGGVTAPSGILNIGGAFTNNSSFANNNGTVVFNGVAAQSISGSTATAFNNFTLTNSNGVNLSGSVDATVNGILNFTNGVITTNANKVILGNASSVSRTSGHVRGNFQKHISTGGPVATNFELGDAAVLNYTPLSVTFSNVSVAGDLIASTTAGDHSLAGSTFTALKTVNRFWTINNSVSSPVSFDNYDASFEYLAGDKDPGVNSSFLYCGKYDLGSWTYPALGTRSATNAQFTGLTSFSDFQLGDCVAPVIDPLVITNTLCNGTSTGAISLTTTGGSQPLTYSWSPGGETTQNISGLAANSYTVTITAFGGCTATASGTVLVTSIDDNNACTTDACDPGTGDITHTLNPIEDDNDVCTIDGCNTLTGPTHVPAISITNHPVNTEVCENGNAGFSIVPFGPGINFQWQDNSSGSMADISGENASTLSLTGVTLSMNERQYQCVISSSCGTLTSSTAILFVDSTTVPGSVGNDAVVCSAGNSGTLTLSNNIGSVVRWESSTDNGSSWTPISNTTTSQDYTNLQITTLYRAVVKKGVCLEENSGYATITVNQSIAIVTPPSNTSICENGNGGFSIVASGTGLNYQWQDNSSGPMADISGETASTLNLSGVTLGMSLRQYQCVLTGACPTLTSSVVTLTVNPTTVAGTVTSDATVCSGANGNTLLLGTHTGNIVRWESSTDGGTVWNPIANITASQGYSNLITTTKYRAVVKSGACPEVPSDPATITVLLSTSITTQPVATTACNGSDATFTIAANGTALIYQWQDNSSGSFADILGQNSTTLVVPAVSPAISGRQYRCVITGSCPAVTSSTGVLTVISNPTSSASATLSSICAGSSTSLSSTGAATTFKTPTTFTASPSVTISTDEDDGNISDIVVSGAPTSLALVTNFSVRINITHPNDADIEVYIVRPDASGNAGTISNSSNGNFENSIVSGTSACLTADFGGSGDNYINTVFSDAAATAISAGTAPYTGSFRPVTPFTAILSQVTNPNGTWRIRVLDDDNGSNTGVFLNWSITMDCLDGISYSWSSTPSGFTSSVQNPGSVSPTQSTTYTVRVTDNQTGCTSTSSKAVNVFTTVDDNDACTIDGCDPITGPTHTPVNTNDGNACTEDGCNTVTGVFHNALITDDGNACTIDACNTLSGSITHIANPAINDNNLCTTDACDTFTGEITNTLNPIEDDGNVCTLDGCDPSSGVYHNNVANGSPASSDDNVCTEDVCFNGNTVHNTLPIVDDGNPCTVDACDPVAGPTHTIDALIIPSDGNVCTTDYCDAAGVAHHDLLPIVDDNNPCTTDGCDAVTGEYHNPVADGSAGATDDNVCTTDLCQGGITVYTALPIVDDGNPCTVDGCNSISGPTHDIDVAIFPGDGNVCTTDYCDAAGVAHHDLLPVVDDNNPCTTDGCDAITGEYHNPVSDGEAGASDDNVCTSDICQGGITVYTTLPIVDDGNPCTVDGCNSISGPTHDIDIAIIPGDGNVCTTDYCDAAGVAHHDLLPVVDDNNPCTTDGCDAITGEYHNPVADGSAGASDDNVCTTDLCQGGITVYTTLPIVDDGNPCTVDGCNSISGPTHDIDVAIIPGDGNVCTTDYCDAAGVAHHDLLPIVDDNNPCTTDGCDAVTGEYHNPVVDGEAGASDDNVCTTDICQGGITVYTTLPIVDDNNVCTIDGCSSIDGPTHTPDVSIIPGDGTVCTTDYCDAAGVAHHDLLPVVDDNNPCTTDGCDAITGEYHNPVADGSAGASDDNVCTSDICQGGITVYTTLPIVDDGNPCTVDGCNSLSGPTHDIDIAIIPGDGNVCTTDYCDAAGVAHHDLLPIVDDNNPCTTDGCDAVTGEYHNPVADGSAGTSDNNVCTEDVCLNGLTVNNTIPIENDGNACTTDGCNSVDGMFHTPVDIDDGNAATIDYCNTVTGDIVHTPVDIDDGDVCTIDESNTLTGVVTHTPVNVDDGNPCTVDGCDSVTGPYHTPDISIIPGDGNLCTTDYCDAAGDAHHDLLPVVDDNNPCTTDGCDAVTGEYHNPVADGEAGASDDNVCTTDICQGGITVYTALPIVDDGNPCTVDGCNSISGPTHDIDIAIIPGDGNVCTTDYCDAAGVAHHDLLPVVDDNNPCTADGCDAVTGEYHNPVADGEAGASDDNVCTTDICQGGITVYTALPIVDDGNPCTVDGCNSISGPTHDIDIAIIPGDGNVCTTDYCDAAGVAHHDLLPVVDDNNPCTTDGCDAITGEYHNPVVDGSAGASDDNVCTTDICVGGITVYTTLPIVDDGNPCTVDGCNSISGPTHDIDVAIIPGDDNVCTTDYCDAAGVAHHDLLPVVDDNNPCTTDGCDAITGEYHNPVVDGSAGASDDNVCTTDICQGGITVYTTLPIVDDGNPCTVDGCNSISGPTHDIDIAIIPGDGNVCTTDYCDAAGVAHHDLLPIVDDNNPCTTDGCDAVTGEYHNAVADGEAGASDDNVCTTDICEGGITVYTTLPIVDDGNPCTIDGCNSITGPTHDIDVAIVSSDGNVCTTDYCDAAGVVHHDLLPIVDDNNPCTIDGCDSITGEYHNNVADGTAGATDGNVCTSDICINGITVYTDLPIENDGNICTTDGCNSINGPTHDYLPIENDNDVCTTDGCNSLTGPTHVTNPIVDDNNVCTTDGCNSVDGPTHVALPIVDDNNVCTTDGCDPVNGPTHDVNPIVNDFNACTTDGCNSLTGPTHTVNPIESDFNVCTTDGCNSLTGPTHVLNPVPSDNNVCTTDGCNSITGIFHTPVNKNDGNPCTIDVCDAVFGVFHLPVNTSDNNACTIDGCNTVTGIVSHVLVGFDDNNVCTNDGCNSTTGVYHFAVNKDDGNACTKDVCDRFFGVFHIPYITDDDNPCTIDICDQLTGAITHEMLLLTDNDACTNDFCDPETGAIEHSPVNIDDGNACTEDGCDHITGIFHNGVSIDDNDACTTDACNTVDGVSHTVNPIEDDNNVCTTDGCSSLSGPTHIPLAIVDDNNVCTADGCDPINGPTHTLLPIVDDNNVCTTDGCDPVTGPTHIALPIVNDNNVCTTDGCDPVTGPSHTPLPIVSDGNICTADGCNSVTGETHVVLTIENDNNVCTVDGCNSITGPTHVLLPVQDDNNVCTTDGCNSISGPTHVLLPTVSDNNVCTVDGCNSITGPTHVLLPVQDDNNVCTTDGCNSISGPTHILLPAVSDNNVCTVDGCNSITGPTHTLLPIQDDNNVCTTDGCNSVSGPTHVDLPIVDDGNVCTTDGCNSVTGPTHVLLPVVSDNNVCTVDGCNSLTGPTHVLLPIQDDNNVCTTDGCNSTSGPTHILLPIVSDNNVCTVDGCNSVTGQTHVLLPIENDNNVCTTDGCNSLTGPTHVPLPIVSDNNVCTVDGCNSVTGQTHVLLPIENDNNVCTTDGCNSVSGPTHVLLPIVNDNNVCTVDGCNSVSGPTHILSPVENDNNVCTTDGCNSVTGPTHVLVPNIDDGNVCTTDGCNSLSGIFHNPVNINDNNLCTTDACDPVTGVSHAAINPTDNNACTIDNCVSSTGLFTHTPVNTNDNNSCTVDACNSLTGVVTNTPVNTNDNNACTTDACNSTTGNITHDPLAAIDDNNLCTTDACNPANGAITHLPVNTNDNNPCTADGCIPASGVFHNPANVNDNNPCTADGCISTSGIFHNDNTPPAPTVSVNNGCSSSVLTAGGFTGTLLWSTGASTTAITVLSQGTYNVTQTVNGCTSLQGSGTATFSGTPPAMPGLISGPTGACRLQNGVVYSIAPVPGATSYLWTLPTGATGSSTTTSITLNFTNTFVTSNLCVVAVGGCGQSLSRCASITQLTVAPGAPGAITGSAVLCPLNTATYSIVAVANATNYAWSGTGGLSVVSGQGSNTVVVSAPAGFVIGNLTVTVSNCIGTNATTSSLTTKGLPSLPIWKTAPPAFACGGACYTFNIDNVQDATTYTYTAPAGCTITSTTNPVASNPHVTAKSAATICFPAGFISGNVTIQSSNSCGNSPILTYAIRSVPVQPGPITGLNSVCKSYIRPYSISTVPTATTYAWTVSGGATISTGQGTTNVNVRYVTATSANATISVTANNTCGASTPRTLAVAVNLACKSAGEAIDNEGTISSIGIYPNPATDRLSLTFNSMDEEQYLVRFVDVLGKIIISEKIYAVAGVNIKEFNLANVAKGLYMISIQSHDGDPKTLRLVVE